MLGAFAQAKYRPDAPAFVITLQRADGKLLEHRLAEREREEDYVLIEATARAQLAGDS